MSSVNGAGFVKENQMRTLQLSGLKVGSLMTRKAQTDATLEILKTGAFEVVEIEVLNDPSDRTKARAILIVKER